ncbi:MAG: cobalamin-dependent protein [Myxococcota bacterium]
MTRRPRILIAKPGLDGHDRGAKVIAAALRDAGCEVVYTGLRATVEGIVATALQEDVDVVGLSVLSGAHLKIAEKVVAGMRARGLTAPVVVGGVIPDRDRAALARAGIAAVFGQEDAMPEVVEQVKRLAASRDE